MKLKISRSENLPVLPTVLVQILRLYEDVNVSARTLETLIAQDPALTARILKVAGSAQYGNQAVPSISRAVSLVGMQTLRSISISLGYQYLLASNNNRSGLDQVALWKHSLATGIAAREIGRVLGMANSEELYVSGLIHDIGILTLNRFAEPELGMVLKTAKLRKISLTEADVATYGFGHDEIGGFLADKWKLSAVTADAIRWHNDPDKSVKFREQTRVVAAANYLAYTIGYPAVPGVAPGSECETFLTQMNLTDEQIAEISTRVAFDLGHATHALGGRAA
ncbi:MAG TPA: HDOD domain-containing protein [Fimbriimonas sp.]|nr:HDOD domain-containing protein [Fimbriimonas sp.]